MKKRVAIAAAVLLIVVGGAWYWHRQQAAAKAEPLTEITFATFSKALGNTPYHVAKYLKRFEERPELKHIHMRYVEFNDRPAISQAFDRGDLQVLFSAEIPAILNYSQGNDIRIMEISGVAAQEIIVPVASRINSVKQLRKETVAVQAGTSSHYCLLKVLRLNSMAPSDVKITYMLPGEAKVAFETGRLPAWAVWAPWVEQEEVAHVGRPIQDSKANISSVMTLSANFLLKHEDVARIVIGILQDSKKWIQQNPDEAQQIAAKELNLDVAVVKQAWPKFDWKHHLSREDFADFEDKAEFLANTKQTRLDQKVDIEKLVDLRFSDNK